MRDSFSLFLLLSLLIMTFILTVEAQSCKPSGKLKGKKPPKYQCNRNNDSKCCEAGKLYNIYKCSPKVTSHTKAVLTINSFEKGKDGGGPSKCDGNYHSDDTPIVALSTGWYGKNKRCFNKIKIHGNGKSVTATVVDECDLIHGNGKSVTATVVDECDSTEGCDRDHDYQLPCPHNIVDGRAVWKALGVPKSKWGEMDITRSDA